jgi:hypothetical protein
MFLPMRPKPFMPTFTAIALLPSCRLIQQASAPLRAHNHPDTLCSTALGKRGAKLAVDKEGQDYAA